ncbi:MAG: FMN-binding protein [Marinagarivorans sp.]|nr:FMN-binding protein [Marinagarivorans sp.]
MKLTRTLLVAGLMLLGAHSPHAEQYLTQEQFLQAAFGQQSENGNAAVTSKTYWLNAADKIVAEQILSHAYAGLRVRYWQNDNQLNKSAWILEEIGKERPIQIGIVIKDQQIEQVSILAFNESRGWEVKHPFFTEQFTQRQLQNNQQLDKKIDGITGATLSVRAVTNTARWALYLAQQIAPITQ